MRRKAVTLHESKHAGYTDLGRLQQHFVGETAPPVAPADPPPAVPVSPMAPVSGARQQPQHRRPQRALYKHADLGPLTADEDAFGRLAALAEPEHWAGPAAFGHDATWVLREYVEWTFERLHQEQRVPTSADGGHSVFNTGLATAQHETIYGLFTPNSDPDGPPWQLGGWLPEGDRRLLDRFPEPPPLATYTEDPADLVYDRRRELVVNPKQLLETKDSLAVLPGPLRSNPYQAGLLIEGAVRRAEARVRRSYRAAVPCWDPAHERVVLLLPLSLTTPESVDVALVAVPEGEIYRGHAVLGLDVAYARARQIARPEEWLTAE
jgi:hypothetical protein